MGVVLAHMCLYYVCLMCGEYDDDLPWPFRGDVSIQLLNQRRDKGHEEKTVPFDDSTPDIYTGRVTEGERTLGWALSSSSPTLLSTMMNPGTLNFSRITVWSFE